jgi:hypothetical protein
MRIDELSVGDWVIYDRDTTPVQIVGLYQRNKQDCVVMSDSYYPEGVIGFVEYLKPIPLTPEILEKNGWSKKYDDVWECGVWRISQINKCLFILYNEKYDYDFCVYIDTVHQLQHALRLAGIEKEIEL